MAAPKFNGADAAVAPKKSRKIGRILETELAPDAAHRTRGVHQAAPSLQCQPLLNQIKGRAAGQSAAQPIQTGFGQRQLPTGAAQLSGCANSCANRSSNCAARNASCGSSRRSMARGMENNVSMGH